MCMPFNRDYFEWLKDIVSVDEMFDNRSYMLLLKDLHSIDYISTYYLDDSRILDGIALRNQYAMDMCTDEPDQGRPCSVLEMLIALSIRIENDVTGFPTYDHPERWFWEMLDNIDLTRCTDEYYSSDYVRQQVDNWMNRRYTAKGVGSIFPLQKYVADQRKKSTWDQAMLYLQQNWRY